MLERETELVDTKKDNKACIGSLCLLVLFLCVSVSVCLPCNTDCDCRLLADWLRLDGLKLHAESHDRPTSLP